MNGPVLNSINILSIDRPSSINNDQSTIAEDVRTKVIDARCRRSWDVPTKQVRMDSRSGMLPRILLFLALRIEDKPWKDPSEICMFDS